MVAFCRKHNTIAKSENHAEIWSLVWNQETISVLLLFLPTYYSPLVVPVDACTIVVPPCTVCKKIRHDQHKTGPSPRSKTFELPSLLSAGVDQLMQEVLLRPDLLLPHGSLC